MEVKKMTYYRFVKWEPAPIENVLQGSIPTALQAYDAGNKKPFNALQIATTDPFYRCGGWCFPLVEYLKKYWVKTKYYGILEYYAVNKTAVRKDIGAHNVIKIVEIN